MGSLRAAPFACLLLAALLLPLSLAYPWLLRHGPLLLSLCLVAGVAGVAALVVATHLQRGRDSRPVRLAWALALIALLCSVYAASYHSAYGWTAMIRFGEAFEADAIPALKATPHYVHRLAPSSEPHLGYDGQFYAQLALDPTLTHHEQMRQGFDAPAYRAQRILLPVMAHVLGLGQPGWVLRAYGLLNFGFWLLLLLLLLRGGRWLGSFGVREAAVLVATCLSCGVIESMAKCLPDLPAAVLILAAVLSTSSRGAVALAAAGLSRNTASLALAGVLVPSLRRRTMGRNASLLLLALLPVAAWYAYVVGHFGAAGFLGHRNIGLPLVAIVERFVVAVQEIDLSTVLSSWHSAAIDHKLHELLTIVAISVQSATVIAHVRHVGSSHFPGPIVRVGLPFAVLALCLGDNVWQLTRAAARVLIPLMLVFNLLLLRSRRALFAPLFVLGNSYSIYSAVGVYSHGAPWVILPPLP